MITNPFELENLFSARFRQKQIAENGFTDAEFVSVDDLCFEATMAAGHFDKGKADPRRVSGCEELTLI